MSSSPYQGRSTRQSIPVGDLPGWLTDDYPLEEWRDLPLRLRAAGALTLFTRRSTFCDQASTEPGVRLQDVVVELVRTSLPALTKLGLFPCEGSEEQALVQSICTADLRSREWGAFMQRVDLSLLVEDKLEEGGPFFYVWRQSSVPSSPSGISSPSSPSTIGMCSPLKRRRIYVDMRRVEGNGEEDEDEEEEDNESAVDERTFLEEEEEEDEEEEGRPIPTVSASPPSSPRKREPLPFGNPPPPPSPPDMVSWACGNPNCRNWKAKRRRKNSDGVIRCYSCYRHYRTHGTERARDVIFFRTTPLECYNCRVTSTASNWHKGPGGFRLCDACWTYYRDNGTVRPARFYKDGSPRKGSPGPSPCPVCSDLMTSKKRGKDKEWNCKACAAYWRKFGRPRPRYLWSSRDESKGFGSPPPPSPPPATARWVCGNPHCQDGTARQYCTGRDSVTRCIECYDYYMKNGSDRPREDVFFANGPRECCRCGMKRSQFWRRGPGGWKLCLMCWNHMNPLFSLQGQGLMLLARAAEETQRK